MQKSLKKKTENKKLKRKNTNVSSSEILETADEDLAMVIENGYVRSKKRIKIEVEIRERQEKWRPVKVYKS